ncbi:MAG: hypothetical protein RJA70_3504, partial [Pseudomonadota bacterium]
IIIVSVRRLGAQAIATVSDNGPGIPEEQASKVFEPFFSTKPPGLGTGLGLSICRSIVETFGGRIEVTSVPGHTEFRVQLPAIDETAPLSAATQAFQSELPETLRGRLLIVDDESSVATMLGRIFETQYSIAICTSAEDALTELSSREFDVILCDVMMPGMNGMALYDELQHQAPQARERIVFMTGGALLPEVDEFLSRVGRPRVEKPFDLPKLHSLLLQVVTGEPLSDL